LCIDLASESHEDAVAAIRRFVERSEIDVLNVAGSRESRSPGLTEAVRDILLGVLVPSFGESFGQ